MLVVELLGSRRRRRAPPAAYLGEVALRAANARMAAATAAARCTYGGHVYITSVEVFSCTYFYRDSNHAVEMSVMHKRYVCMIILGYFNSVLNDLVKV